MRRGDLSVQDIAAPLVAAAHAGMPTLAVCAMTDTLDAQRDLATLVAATAAEAPSLDRLLHGLARELHRLVPVGSLAAAVLVSGTGRHLENLCASKRSMGGAVSICISSKGVLALERAADAASRRGPREGRGRDDRTYGERIFEEIESRRDTVVLAGFLKKLWILGDFPDGDQHPPVTPGVRWKGFYGPGFQAAALCQVSGCTVHLVDEIYAGPILVQRWCPVEPDDSADTLAARVFEQELEALPEGLRRFWSSNS